jgi:hypothetical protein
VKREENKRKFRRVPHKKPFGEIKELDKIVRG